MSTPPEFEAPPPYVPPPSEAPKKTLVPLGFAAPFQWLRSGWADMRAHSAISGFYGLAFWLMAVVLGAVFRSNPEYTMTIASGCLLVGPFLAMGLYEVSHRRETGLMPDLLSSATCWRSHIKSMGMLVLVLIVMPSTSGVMEAIFNPQNWEFVLAYLVVGGAFAALVFSVTVVSIPMILDRDTDAISAAITSLEVVFHNPAVVILWGFLITGLIAVSLALPWGIGLLLSGPLLGHATWYAYRGSVRWPQDVTVP
jgi:uncharacterized membrane protein